MRIYENDDGKQAIVYDIQVKFLAQRGPKEHEGLVKFNYFVGIGGPGGQILKREVFDSEIVFKNNATQAITIEEIQPRIPLKQGENGDFYRIYVGFMLDERELAYNRKNPRWAICIGACSLDRSSVWRCSRQQPRHNRSSHPTRHSTRSPLVM